MKELKTDQEPRNRGRSKLEMTRKACASPSSIVPANHLQGAIRRVHAYGDWVSSTLAWQISTYASFTVEVEGHTEAGQKPECGLWRLGSLVGTRHRLTPQAD
jgi:hypothetical protein